MTNQLRIMDSDGRCYIVVNFLGLENAPVPNQNVLENFQHNPLPHDVAHKNKFTGIGQHEYILEKLAWIQQHGVGDWNCMISNESGTSEIVWSFQDPADAMMFKLAHSA